VKDLLLIALLTLGSCLAVGVVGSLVLHRLRRASLRYQLLVAALLPVLAVSGTVAVNVGFMFLSRHDSGVVLVALGLSLVLAAVGSYLVIRRVAAGFRRLALGVEQLVADSVDPVRWASAESPTSFPAVPVAKEQGVPAMPAELAAALANLTDARRAIAESRVRERAAEQSRRELVSFLSHDLRTPLAGLRALAEGMEDGVVNDVPGALAHLRGTVGRMTGLVDDLFALSRAQAPAANKERTHLSLVEVINDVTSEAMAAAAAAGVQIRVDAAAGDRLAVLGDSADLTRALANLLSNAIRHTDPGRSVQVEAGRAADGAVQVSVRDQCGGIPAANLARVFDTGWRGSPARGSGNGGAGLGLAIARGVVESHQGMIGVRNTTDGCCFDVQLPAPARGAPVAAPR
jgi:signal transduction histidine kinase